MREVRTTIENFILNHDRNKRLLALFLALAILVSFAVPASLIQPANSLTADNGGATALSDTTGIEVSTTVGAPATGNDLDGGGVLHKNYFESVCPFIPKGADDLENCISDVSVSITDASNNTTVYDPTNNNITLPAGSADGLEFKLELGYTLTAADIAKLSTSEPCMYYVLPENFEVLEDLYGMAQYVVDNQGGDSYAAAVPKENGIAAHVSVDKETGLVVIQFTDEYLEYVKGKGSATGTFGLSGTMGRSETADGDSKMEIGDFKVEAEFDDKPNDVNKSQGTVTPNANGGADIDWTVTVYDTGFGLDNWTVSDSNFPVGGNGVAISPDGVNGSWNGTQYTISSVAQGTTSVTFTYTQHLTVEQIEAMYDSDNLTVKNDVTITNPDGLTDSTQNNAYLTKPTIEKIGTPDYETGDYNKTVNWELVVTHPYGGSLKGYTIDDSQFNQYDASHWSLVSVKDENGNDVQYTISGNGSFTITDDNASTAVIKYTQVLDSVGYAVNNTATLKDDNNKQVDVDTETVFYENATNLAKRGVYDPETGKVVWFVTAQAHIGVLNNYKIYDSSVFLYENAGGTFTSLDQFDIITVSGKNGDSEITDLIAEKNADGSVTYKDSNGTVYGTLSYVETDRSQYAVQVTSADSDNSIGLTKVEFSFATNATDGLNSNNVQDELGNSGQDEVTPSCQYAIDKSGAYNAANGTIEWTISVKNNTALDSASLNGVILSDAALKGMSASDLALSWAKNTNGDYSFTLSSSGNAVTIKDSNGNTVATLNIDSAAGTITFSDVTAGFNDIGLKYSKIVDSEDVKNAASEDVTVTNTLSADVPGVEDPTPVEESVKVTNPYQLTKSGKYDASTGNITWTVYVKNESGSLNGVTLTDDAFAELAVGTQIEITELRGYNGTGVEWNLTHSGSNNNFTFGSNGEYGTMVLDGDTVTFTDSSSGKGVHSITFTYQTKAQNLADGATVTNTISSNKRPDVVSDTVTITNPYTVNKSGATYNAETGLITWNVTLQNGTNQWAGDSVTLDNVVLYDEAFKNIDVTDFSVLSAVFSYHSDLKILSTNGNQIVVGSDSEGEYGTITLDKENGTITFKDSGKHSNGYYYGIWKIQFTYTTVATPEEIEQKYAENTIGPGPVGVGPSTPSTDRVDIVGRDEMSKTYTGIGNVNTYGDAQSAYSLEWKINLLKDSGYSSGDLVLIDALTTTGQGGKHYITAEQLNNIQIMARSLQGDTPTELSSDLYTVEGKNPINDSDGNLLGYANFEIKFLSGVDEIRYRYMDITYNTTADVSGVVGENNGTTVTFNNSASFGTHTNVTPGNGFSYTEIPADYVERIDITVKKTWSDESNKHNTRTDLIQFKLKQKIGNGEWTDYDKDGDGTFTDADLFTINAVDGQNSWSLLIEDLPKTTLQSEGGETIYYKVEEISKVNGYTTTYNGNTDYINTNGSVIEIINTLDCIKVDKTWVDDNNKFGTRPESITVQLQQRPKDSTNDADWADVEGAVATIPDAQGNWNYTFTGIDVSQYKYRVVEFEVDGYKTSYTNNDGISTGQISITNTLIQITFQKTWVDSAYDPIANNSATIKLQYRSEGGEWQDYTDSDGNPYQVTLSPSTAMQTHTWYGLNPAYEYRVEEIAVDGYKTTYTNNDGISTGTIGITNTLTKVNVQKVWQGYANGTQLPNVDVTLQYSDDNGATWADYSDANGIAYTVTLAPNGAHIWYGLNPDYIYRVVEKNVPSGYSVSYSADSVEGINGYIKVTNKSNNIVVNKHWADNYSSSRPTNTTVGLYKIVDGEEVLVEEKTLSGFEWEKLTWYALDPNYTYVVKEATVDGYVTIYKNKTTGVESQNVNVNEEIDITNTKNNIKIDKNWKDINGNDVTPDVDEITLEIYQTQNGVYEASGSVDKTEVTYNDNTYGQYELPDLQKGDVITITMHGSGYSTGCNGCIAGSNTDDDNTWYSIVWDNGTLANNTMTFKVEITANLTNVVLQSWNNYSAFTSLDYSIQRWTLYDTITVTPDDSGKWTANISNLPMGVAPAEYVYKVVENDVEGYYVEYTNNGGVDPTSNQTITVTNKAQEKINKTSYDKDGTVIQSGSVIDPSKLKKETINGTEYYLLEYVISSNRDEQKSMVIDTLPSGWTLCEDASNKDGKYGPFMSDGRSETSIVGWTNTVYYQNNGDTVSFYIGWAEYIRYFIKIPVETLQSKIEETNSVLIENTVISESENSSPTTNKIIVAGSTSNEDQELLDKIASILGGTLNYQVVFNPDGKNLANGDVVDLIDDFNIIEYLKKNGSGLTDAELADIEVSLNLITVEHAQNITYTEYGTIEYDQVANLNPSYRFEKDGRVETSVKELTFEKTINNGGQELLWKTSGYSVGDTIVFTLDATQKASSGYFVCLREGNGWTNKDIATYPGASYNENTNQWTVEYTVESDLDFIGIVSNEVSWGSGYITDVSATCTTVTKLSDATIHLSVPDETPLVITYSYKLSGIKKNGNNDTLAGDTLTATNEISFDTGNASSSDSAERDEFIITDSFGTITAGTSPTIKKISISDYSVEVAAEFKMAYWDANLGWVFAVGEEAVLDSKGQPTGTVKPVWTTDGATDVAESNSIHTNANTIPSGTHTFKLGSIDINLENEKLYRMVEVSMPFGYEGYDLEADFNTKYLNSTNSEYADYIEAVKASMTAAGRTSAVFEDLLQGYLGGKVGPYNDFFNEFEAEYYFAYQDAECDKPDNFNEEITTVSTTGELVLNNSEMIEIKIDKTWDQTALEAIGGEEIPVKSIVELYWSTTKKSSGFPDTMTKVSADDFNILNETNFENPKTVEKDAPAFWGLLPSGYKGQPIYYYVKEVGYIIGDEHYYLIGDEYVLVDSDTISSGNPTPIKKDGTEAANSSEYVLGKLKPIYTGNGSNNSTLVNDSNNKQVTIDIQNTAGLKIEKIWKTSDNKDLENPPLSEVPLLLYGTVVATGVEELIGNIDSFKVTAENDWNLVINEDDYDLSKYKSFRVVENIPADQQHLIYGYTVSYTYNTNGPSGTITVTNKDNTPTKVNVKAEKEWADATDHSSDSVTVQLYQTTTPQPIDGVVADGTAYGDPVVLNSSNSWKHTWNELDYKDSVSGLRNYYYIVETVVDSNSGVTYKAIYSRDDKSKEQNLTVTNYVPGSITIDKSWFDANGVEIPADSLLLPEGIDVDIYRRPDERMVNEGGATLPSGLQIMPNGDSITQGTFAGYVPENNTYPAVLKELLGDVVVNKVSQDGRHISEILSAYQSSSYAANADVVIFMAGTNDLLHNNSTKAELKTAMKGLIDAAYTTSGNDTAVFVLSVPRITACDWYNRYKDLDGNTFQKNDQEDSDALVTAYNNMLQELISEYTGDNKPIYVDVKTPIGDNLVDGCHPSAAGYQILAETVASAINQHYGVGTVETPKDIDTVPEDITDSTKYEHVGTYTVNKTDDWSLSIELPTMDEHNVNYVYYAVEKTTGYTVQYDANGQIISDGDNDTISLTNTVDTEKTSITIEKVWYDNNSASRPSSVTMQLQQKLESASEWTNYGESFTITSADEWKKVITDLDVTDISGEKYYYQVVENVPSGYKVTYGDTNGDAAAVSGTTIKVTNTKTFSLTVEKEWADENHVLNEGVDIEIYRDTVENTGDNGLTIMPMKLEVITPANKELSITTGKTGTVTVNKADTTVSFDNELASAVVSDKTITVTAGSTTGSSVMTITDADGQTVKVNITITDKPALSLTLDKPTIIAGDTATISAELSDGTSTSGITYAIINGADYADLSGNILTGKSKGTVTVEGTLVIDGETYKAQTTLNVNLSDSFTLSSSSNTVEVGKTVTVVPEPEFGRPFTYSSSDDSIATVDANGVVTGVSAGKVTITAERSDGETATVDITVPLAVSPESVTLATGGTQQITANGNVTYSSNNESVATVSDSGLITAVGDGTATITVASADGQTKTIAVTVSSGPLKEFVENGSLILDVDNTKVIQSIQIVSEDFTNTNYKALNIYNTADRWNGGYKIDVSYSGSFSFNNATGCTGSANGNTITILSNSDFNKNLDSITVEYNKWSGWDSPWTVNNIVVTYADGTVVTYSAANPNGSISGGSGGSATTTTTTTTTSTSDGGSSGGSGGETTSTATGGPVSLDGSAIDVDETRVVESITVKVNLTSSWTSAKLRINKPNGSYQEIPFYWWDSSQSLNVNNANRYSESENGDTFTENIGYEVDSIQFIKSDGVAENMILSYTITYASSSPQVASLRYAPPVRAYAAYALLADVSYPELVTTIKITSSDQWSKIVADLPVYDSEGNEYYYWIKEVGANGFTPSYSFSDGDDVTIDKDYCINAANPGSATATVKNTPNDTSTTLPSTGGQGTLRYYVTGIGIMLCTLAGIYGFKRRQRSQS